MGGAWRERGQAWIVGERHLHSLAWPSSALRRAGCACPIPVSERGVCLSEGAGVCEGCSGRSSVQRCPTVQTRRIEMGAEEGGVGG